MSNTHTHNNHTHNHNETNNNHNYNRARSHKRSVSVSVSPRYNQTPIRPQRINQVSLSTIMNTRPDESSTDSSIDYSQILISPRSPSPRQSPRQSPRFGKSKKDIFSSLRVKRRTSSMSTTSTTSPSLPSVPSVINRQTHKQRESDMVFVLGSDDHIDLTEMEDIDLNSNCNDDRKSQVTSSFGNRRTSISDFPIRFKPSHGRSQSQGHLEFTDNNNRNNRENVLPGSSFQNLRSGDPGYSFQKRSNSNSLLEMKSPRNIDKPGGNGGTGGRSSSIKNLFTKNNSDSNIGKYKGLYDDTNDSDSWSTASWSTASSSDEGCYDEDDGNVSDEELTHEATGRQGNNNPDMSRVIDHLTYQNYIISYQEKKIVEPDRFLDERHRLYGSYLNIDQYIIFREILSRKSDLYQEYLINLQMELKLSHGCCYRKSFISLTDHTSTNQTLTDHKLIPQLYDYLVLVNRTILDDRVNEDQIYRPHRRGYHNRTYFSLIPRNQVDQIALYPIAIGQHKKMVSQMTSLKSQIITISYPEIVGQMSFRHSSNFVGQSESDSIEYNDIENLSFESLDELFERGKFRLISIKNITLKSKHNPREAESYDIPVSTDLYLFSPISVNLKN